MLLVQLAVKVNVLPNVFIGMVINDVSSVILVRSAIYNMHA